MLSIASLATFVEKRSNCSHVLAPFKLYKKRTGKDNVIEALENVDALVIMMTETYTNPRTCRNYMAGLKVCVTLKEVATYFTSAKCAHIIGVVDVELQKLNHISYMHPKFTGSGTAGESDVRVKDLVEENEMLWCVIKEYERIVAGGCEV